MKNKFLTFVASLLACVLTASVANAGNLTYTTLPQTGDSDLVMAHKADVAMARMEFGNSYVNITTSGTTNVAGPVVLDRLVVATSGTTSTLVLSAVTASATTAIGSFTTVAQTSIPLGIRISGTLRAVTAGGSPADLVLSYR